MNVERFPRFTKFGLTISALIAVIPLRGMEGTVSSASIDTDIVQGQEVLTVSEGKRLIARAVAQMPIVKQALKEGIVIIASGTTNTYVAEEILGRTIEHGAFVSGRTYPAKGGQQLEPETAMREVTNYQPSQNDPLPQLAVDASGGPARGRVYLVYQDGARLSGTKDVLMRFSDDRRSWTAPFPVNDPIPSVDRLLPNVAVDSSSGAVVAAWYDFRDGSNSAQLRGRVLAQVGAPATPDAPLNLLAEPASTSEIRLRWTDRSSNETAFEIERFAFGFPGSFFRIAVVGANTTTFVDSGLAPDTSGLYRIRSVNANGASPYANEAGTRTLATPPTAPSASEVGLATSSNTWPPPEYTNGARPSRVGSM